MPLHGDLVEPRPGQSRPDLGCAWGGGVIRDRAPPGFPRGPVLLVHSARLAASDEGRPLGLAEPSEGRAPRRMPGGDKCPSRTAACKPAAAYPESRSWVSSTFHEITRALISSSGRFNSMGYDD